MPYHHRQKWNVLWIQNGTRATFATSNYPRQPWDQYTAPNSKCIGAACATPPAPPQKKKRKKLFILVIGLVEKIGRTVKQCSDLKSSSIPLQSLEVQLSSLSLVAVLLILFVCQVHSGSHQYSWFSRISSTVANRYRKSTSLLKRNVSITSIS